MFGQETRAGPRSHRSGQQKALPGTIVNLLTITDPTVIFDRTIQKMPVIKLNGCAIAGLMLSVYWASAAPVKNAPSDFNMNL